MKVVVKPYGKIHVLHSLREESTFFLEQGNRGLYIIDDRQQAIVLKQQGSENKLFHVCEKSALHVIQRFDQSLQPLSEDENYNKNSQQGKERESQYGNLDQSNPQSQYVQLFFDEQADNRPRAISKSTIEQKPKKSQLLPKSQISKGQKRSNILNTLINNSGTGSPFRNTSRIRTTIVSNNNPLHIINFESRSSFNLHSQVLNNQQSNAFLHYQPKPFIGQSILHPIKSQINSDQEYDKKDMFDQRTKCKLCHQNFPKNHIIRVSHQGTSKVVPNRDVVQRQQIEQIIIDPIHGVVKREFHFAIVGYLTPLSKRKLIKREKQSQMQNMNEKSINIDKLEQQNRQQSWQRKAEDKILDPLIYSQYFMRTIEEILQ